MEFKHGLLISIAILASCLAQADVGHAKLRENKQIPLKTPDEIRVLVIDSGVSPNDSLTKYVNYLETNDYFDENGHGTLMAGIISRGPYQRDPVCPEVRIFSCKHVGSGSRPMTQCLDMAYSINADLVNMSVSGFGPEIYEYKFMKKLSDAGVTMIVAAGNESKLIDSEPMICPACYAVTAVKMYDVVAGKTIDFEPIPNVIAVSNLDENGKLVKSSNFHPKALKIQGTGSISTLPKNFFAKVGGTSAAAANATHALIQDRCRKLKQRKIQ